MAWVILLIAGLLEVGWAICLKSAKGFTLFWPSLGFAVFMLASVYLLGVALKSLPLGTAYTVWTGIGAVGTVILGILVFGESADPRRLGCIALILAGIVGLKLASPPDKPAQLPEGPTASDAL
jgi:quaternary ammonium compound-resistance protein SugE